MNPFDEVIGHMRVQSSLYAKFRFRAPWGVVFQTGEHARLVVVTRGECWLRKDGDAAPVRIEAGVCMLVKPHVVFSLSDVPDRSVVPCRTLLPSPTLDLIEHGGDGAQTEIVSGRFSFDPLAAEPLLGMMPDLTHFKLDEGQTALMGSTLDLIGAEASRNGYGAGFVVDRLGDALLVQILRALCRADDMKSSCWMAGLADKRLARTLHAVHADLARPWTVEEMAREAGLSRSSFAALFKAVIGEAPLDYVTNWRIYRAKMLLASTNDGILRVANLVGYESDIALSRAFRRRTGFAPGQWRQMAKANRGALEGTLLLA